MLRLVQAGRDNLLMLNGICLPCFELFFLNSLDGLFEGLPFEEEWRLSEAKNRDLERSSGELGGRRYVMGS